MTARRRLPFLAVSAAPLLAPAVASGQWQDYRPARLATVVKENAADAQDHPAGMPLWSFSMLPIRVSVTYTGKSRPLSAVRDTLLQRWVVTRNVDSAAATAVSSEFLFRESGNEYWLVVQDVLVKHLRAELAPGDEVTLFVLWAGTHHLDGPITWLFLVNEFLAGSGGPDATQQAVATAGTPLGSRALRPRRSTTTTPPGHARFSFTW